jgi:hypothetical protein
VAIAPQHAEFYGLLIGVQTALDKRGRSTIYANYRLVPKLMFVGVISLALTSPVERPDLPGTQPR